LLCFATETNLDKKILKWHYICIETQPTLIYHYFFQIGTNIPKYLEEARRSPFVLILGNRDAPCQCFVIVEGKAIEQSNLVKALDVCFKLFYVLDIHYPWQSAHAWEFVQKCFYGLDDDEKKQTSPAVISLRAALK
jgi:hypothetical protein